MRALFVTGSLLGLLALLAVANIPVASAQPQGAPVTRHCGSFKYGSDGSQPGPSQITAKRVSCRFARGLALRGGANGWHCHIAMGLEFVCRPARGRGVVTFLGE
jgi:hypothetical protein